MHVITQKGRGYDPAINDEADQFHAVGVINPETGLPLEIAGRSWTDEFSDEIVRIGEERQDIVAITAAMMIPVGLDAFAKRFPERTFDVGIAEQHATDHGRRPGVHRPASGCRDLRHLPEPRLRPAAHGLRAPQGRRHVRARPLGHHRPRRRLAPRHVGHVDQPAIVPGLHLAAPRDGQQIPRAAACRRRHRRRARRSSASPRARSSDAIDAVRTVDGVDVLVEPDWTTTSTCCSSASGPWPRPPSPPPRSSPPRALRVRVVDPVWALPVNPAVAGWRGRARHIAVVEDNSVAGGVGSHVMSSLRDSGY